MQALDEGEFLRRIAQTLMVLERKEAIQRDATARQDLWVLRQAVEE